MSCDAIATPAGEIDRSEQFEGSRLPVVKVGIGKINCTECEATSKRSFCAINCTRRPASDESAQSPLDDPADLPSAWIGAASAFPASPAAIRDLLTQSLSGATKRAYESDRRHFEDWGGTIPASPEAVAEYLASQLHSHKAATIARRLASLAKVHRAKGFDDPTKAEIVKATLRGIKRVIGVKQREARPILKEDLFAILERMGDRPRDLRDKALLLIGFAGAFRRSELVGLDVADIEQVRQGIVVTLRRSKTDQLGAGRKIGIPFGRTRWCPVKHLTDWLDLAGIAEGPIFRVIGKGGTIEDRRLSGEAVSLIVKQRAQAAGFDPAPLSGHSLRAGLATSAALAGASTFKIRAQTGHASDAMLARYIRDGSLFEHNAAGAVL